MRRVQTLMAEFGDCLVLCMCDDVFILGPPDRAAAALTRYRELVQADHGRLNLPKSIIWSPTAASTQHPDIQALAGVRATPDAALTGGFDVRGPDSGLRVLGHPLGADGYCRGFYMDKAVKTQTVVDKIIEVADYSNPVSIQAAYLQLRYCAEPKIAHLDWVSGAAPPAPPLAPPLG